MLIYFQCMKKDYDKFNLILDFALLDFFKSLTFSSFLHLSIEFYVLLSFLFKKTHVDIE